MGYSGDCKRRGIRLSLTFWRDRWKKFFDGKTHYFRGSDTKAGYEAALTAYAIARNAPTFPDEAENLELAKRAGEWYRFHGEPDGEEGEAAKLETILASKPNLQSDTRCEWSFEVEGITDKAGRAKWRERLRVPTKRTSTIGEAIGLFLDKQRSRVNTGTIQERTLATLEVRLNEILKHIDPRHSVESIDGRLIEKLYTTLANQNWTNTTRENHRGAFRQFVRWCYSSELIAALPRNLGEGFNKAIGKDGKAKRIQGDQLWKAEDLRQVAALSEWWEMIVLLMLNCGFTSVDLEHLAAEDIDFDAGRIRHQRHKTERIRNPPVVNYKLWNRTLELLKVHANRKGKAIQMPSGARIQTKTSDNLSHGWLQLKKANSGSKSADDAKQAKRVAPQKRLDHCRKTGATFFKKHGMSLAYLCDKAGAVDTNFYVYHDGEPHPDFDVRMAEFGKLMGVE